MAFPTAQQLKANICLFAKGSCSTLTYGGLSSFSTSLLHSWLNENILILHADQMHVNGRYDATSFDYVRKCTTAVWGLILRYALFWLSGVWSPLQDYISEPLHGTFFDILYPYTRKWVVFSTTITLPHGKKSFRGHCTGDKVAWRWWFRK